MGIIEIKGVKKSFGPLQVYKDLNLSVEPGEVISVIGGSGCGKSVLLRCIEMLTAPDEGQIFINGEEITAKGADIGKIRRNMGMVYQDFGLFSNMNVMDNLCLAPTKLLGMSREAAEEKALELLEMVGLSNWAYNSVKNLSGGQKQRVAIARCMMMDPPIILFDEPTSALDPTMVGEVLATIRMLAKRGLTMIIVTHEMNFAQQIASRVLFLAEGGIYEQGTPEDIFEHPQREKTIAFIRKLKYFSYHVDRRKYDLMELQGGIIEFAIKYGLDANESNRLQTCTEEILLEILNGCYKDSEDIDIDVDIVYSEKDKTCELQVNAGGTLYNPFAVMDDENVDMMDHLGLMIIKRKAKECTYDVVNDRNMISIRI